MPIGTFARRCGLSVSALRFYDECDVLEPAEVDPATGYRSYDEFQIADATLIRRLRTLDVPVATIRDFLAAPASVRHKVVRDHVAGLAEQLEVARAEAVALHRAIDAVEGVLTMSVTADSLGRALDQVLPAAGIDPKRSVLQSVLIESRDGSLRLVATDSYRLAVRDLVGDGGGEFRALIRRDDVERVRGDIGGDEPAHLEVSDGHLVIETAGETVAMVLRDDAFPNYEQLLAVRDDAHPMVVDRAGLIAVVEQSDEQVLWMDLQRDSVLIDGDGLVTAHYDGPELTIAMNRDYALAGMRLAVGPDLAIEATSPTHPIVFRSATDGTYVYMLMPVRVG